MEGDWLNYKVEYNKAIEFISAISKYARSREQQTNWKKRELTENLSGNLLNFVPTREVKEWLEYVNNNISPFLRNDTILLSIKMFALADSCLKLIIDNNLQDFSELMDMLQTIEGSRLIELMYREYALDIPLTAEDKVIKDELIESYSEEIASYFIQAKNHPEEYKKRVIDTYETFYNLYYKPFEDKVYSFMAKKCVKLNEIAENDFLKFINTVGYGNYSEVIGKDKKFRVFVSYYIDVGMINFYNRDTFIMFCGHSSEQWFNSISLQEKAKNLFKALSDDKRLEIIKVTSKRPWYNKELADYLNLSPATLSYHINILLSLDVLNFEPSIDNKYYYTTNINNLKSLFDKALSDILG